MKYYGDPSVIWAERIGRLIGSLFLYATLSAVVVWLSHTIAGKPAFTFANVGLGVLIVLAARLVVRVVTK